MDENPHEDIIMLHKQVFYEVLEGHYVFFIGMDLFSIILR
jgi:hypothetical protein